MSEEPDVAPRQRYLLIPPGETRPSLLVELCPKVDESVFHEVKQAMFGLGCGNALVLDTERCFILRDTFQTMDAHSIEVEPVSLETQKLLDLSGDPVAQRLERWLNALATNWHNSIPREAWTAPLLSDVVPAASGSLVRKAMMRATT